MEQCNIKFGGVNFSSIGLIVEGYPSTTIPARDIKTVQIPGRNGEVLFDNGGYNNYTQTYTVHWKKDYTNENSPDFPLNKLFSKYNYYRLEDSFHDKYYRKARLVGGNEVENRINVIGRSKIKFDCKPQWFRKDGENKIEIISGNTLTNTGLVALPKFYIYGNGNGTMTVNSTTISISDLSDVAIVLDAETQEAYLSSNNSSYNSKIEINNYRIPSLVTGSNAISYSGGITKVEIIPQWWDII